MHESSAYASEPILDVQVSYMKHSIWELILTCASNLDQAWLESKQGCFHKINFLLPFRMVSEMLRSTTGTS